MNDEVDPRESSIAHLWRWHAYRCVTNRPKLPGRAIPPGFAAFLLLLGSTCDPDGVNKRPPSRDNLAAFCFVSQASIRGYWNAASSLGLVDVRYANGDGRVLGYTLKMTPAHHLDWHACAEIFAGDRRRVLQEKARSAERKKRAQEEARAAVEAARSGSREPFNDPDDALNGSREPFTAPDPAPDEDTGAITAHVSRSGPELDVPREPFTDTPDIDLNGSREPRRTAHGETWTAHVSRRPGPTKTNHDGADAVDQPADPPRVRPSERDPDEPWLGHMVEERQVITEEMWNDLPRTRSEVMSIV